MNDNIDTTLPFGGAPKHEHSSSAADSIVVVSYLRPAETAPKYGVFPIIVTNKAGHKMDYTGKRENGEWVGVFNLKMENMPAWIPYITHWLDVTKPDGFYDR